MKLKGSIIFDGASGKFGNIVFRQVNGKTFISKRPAKPGKISPAQQKQRERFSEAAAYAREQIRDQATRDEYARGINDHKHSAYAVAVTDFMTAPKIHEVDIRAYRGRSGNLIRIKATDDFKVTAVEVKIINAAGAQVECGPAWQQSKLQWHYNAQQANATLSGTRVIVTASDKPGNQATMEKLLE
jgi:hypothetical protein